jgi:maltose/maltodextrin transport system permease protein
MKTPSSLLSKLIAAVASLAMLWLAFSVYASGEPLWALALVVFGGTSLYVYLSATTLAWRYLFPGVAAMVIFVAFPLVYTIQIGFTNYSSSNLLTEARSRAYLLEQADVNESRAFATTVHSVGSDFRLVLVGQGEGGTSTR